MAHRLYELVRIDIEEQRKIERFGDAFRCNHYLLFSPDELSLWQEFTSEQFEQANKMHVGVMSLGTLYSHFYIMQDNGVLRGYNTHSSFSVFSFYYSYKDFDGLSLVAQQNVQQSIETIKEAITWKIIQNDGLK